MGTLVVGVAAIFAAILLGLAATAVLGDHARGVSRSLAVVEAFSAAPPEMQKELEPSFNDRVISPFLNSLVALGRRITPSDYADRTRHRLDVAGNPRGWSVDRVVSLKVVGILVGVPLAVVISLALSLGLAPALVVILGVSAVGYFAPNIYLYQRGAERTEKMQKALPDAIDLLTISVEAGLGFDSALAQVARNTEGPLSMEFARVLQEMQIGVGRAEALRALGERTTLPDLRAFASAMVQADAFGIPIGQVLRVQSGEIRVKRRQRAEEKAQKVPVKLLMPLMIFILPCLFLAVMGPGVISIIGMFGSL